MLIVFFILHDIAFKECFKKLFRVTKHVQVHQILLQKWWQTCQKTVGKRFTVDTVDDISRCVEEGPANCLGISPFSAQVSSEFSKISPTTVCPRSSIFFFSPSSPKDESPEEEIHWWQCFSVIIITWVSKFPMMRAMLSHIRRIPRAAANHIGDDFTSFPLRCFWLWHGAPYLSCRKSASCTIKYAASSSLVFSVQLAALLLFHYWFLYLPTERKFRCFSLLNLLDSFSTTHCQFFVENTVLLGVICK